MSSDLFRGLRWLPEPPQDFNTLCRGALETASPGKSVRALAGFALDENRLNRLAKTVVKAAESGISLAPLVPFKLGVIGNATLDLVIPCLIGSAARHGLALECVTGHFDQVMQDALSPVSAINASRPDAVLIAVDHRALPLRSALGNRDDEDNAVAQGMTYLESVRAGIKAHSKAVCIMQTLAPPPEPLFGSFDAVLPGTLRHVIARLNLRLAESVLGSEDILLDVAGLAATVGTSEWHSPAQWNMAKLAFSSDYLPLYAEHVSRVLAALRGKSRRALVLDLDNTLWGGVIGDDGIDGIQVAQGDATGEAHLAVQRLALLYRERGIALAVSSKNDDAVARTPFREHPEMLLKEEHIAVFQANWNDKATNLKAIAETLSLGTDSLVFLDDNPVERGLVRSILPEVAVPELPSDPALYARTLAAAGYFESVLFAEEDAKRAAYYQDNAKRVELQKAAGDIEAYLASLEMVITFQAFDDTGRARITQLINKSNQFNLTTRRYTEPEVAAIERDPQCFTLQVRLADKFGDNGMISVIICRETEPKVWEFDTWLMSCRVLGRHVERMVLREVLEHARRRQISTLIGVYRKTDRNNLVANHYSNLGFIESGRRSDGSQTWVLEVATAVVSAAPMIVHSARLS